MQSDLKPRCDIDRIGLDATADSVGLISSGAGFPLGFNTFFTRGAKFLTNARG